MKSFRPMLSGKAPSDLAGVKLPVLVSPKLDGIRCIIHEGKVVSRNLKPIPNRHVQDVLSTLPDGLDGELIVGDTTGNDVMQRTASGVMSEDGKPVFNFCVFDMYTAEGGFSDRLAAAVEVVDLNGDDRIVLVEHFLAPTAEQVASFEEKCIAAGFEGVMIRDPAGRYKYGRSTDKEGLLLKLKRFEDAEAVVVDTVERMHNANVATTNKLGLTERSSSKSGKKATGTLGALVCEMPSGVRFEIGSGFTEEQRRLYWLNRTELVGRHAKYKMQNLTPDGVPRFPVFLGWRHSDDA